MLRENTGPSYNKWRVTSLERTNIFPKSHTQEGLQTSKLPIDQFKLELSVYLQRKSLFTQEQKLMSFSQDLTNMRKSTPQGYLKGNYFHYHRHHDNNPALQKWKKKHSKPDKEVRSMHKKSFTIKQMKPTSKPRNLSPNQFLSFHITQQINSPSSQILQVQKTIGNRNWRKGNFKKIQEKQNPQTQSFGPLTDLEPWQAAIENNEYQLS